MTLHLVQNEVPPHETPRIRSNGKRSVRNQLNDLSAKEWISETVSVWTQRGLGKNHAEAQIERQHPAPFSYQDVARLICFFSKRGQTVLDPFVGVGSTLKAAAIHGRRGIGIELQPTFAKLAARRLKVELNGSAEICHNQRIITGDCFTEIPSLPAESVNLIVTSPPYWRILHKQDHKAKQERLSKGLASRYSDSRKDLGNIASYNQFISRLGECFALCRRVLATKGHLCIIVSDFREKSRYHMFHSDLANVLEGKGYTLKGITILYQRHKRVFPYGYPSAFVPNIHHQYVLILKKDD